MRGVEGEWSSGEIEICAKHGAMRLQSYVWRGSGAQERLKFLACLYSNNIHGSVEGSGAQERLQHNAFKDAVWLSVWCGAQERLQVLRDFEHVERQSGVEGGWSSGKIDHRGLCDVGEGTC